MTDDNRISPAARTVEVLLALCDGPQSLGQVSEATNLPKPTAHRLLSQLIDASLAHQTHNQRYMLGVRALELGEALLSAPAWRQAFTARPELQEFARRTGETVTIHIRMGDYRMCIAEFESTNALRYVGGVGLTVPLHVGSAGKVLLAMAPTANREQYLTTFADGEGASRSSSVDVAALRKELVKVRSAGWAESTGERIDGASAVSVPVCDADGGLLACLSVLGPTLRLGPDVRRKLVPELRTMAAHIGGAADTMARGKRAGT